ncbi:MAG: IclR family transcriptional regulator [Pseudomonadota bacterium]
MKPAGQKSKVKLKRVPAVDKCFKVLGLLAASKSPLGITELSTRLGYHKSTVFNLIYTLVDLGVLEMTPENKLRLGMKLYTLGREAGAGSNLISKVRPYLEEINQKTKLSVFLGLRSGLKAAIVDKVDSPDDIKVSSEMGMKIPLIAGAGGKVLLSQLPEAQVEAILSKSILPRFTPSTCTNLKRLTQMIKKARQEGFALDDEEYIQGIRALAIPLKVGRPDLQAAIWVVGLKSRVTDEKIFEYRDLLKKIGTRIEAQFS